MAYCSHNLGIRNNVCNYSMQTNNLHNGVCTNTAVNSENLYNDECVNVAPNSESLYNVINV